jgi:Holliday junction resolvasome RuvABC DNA-binding subunit
MIGSLKGKLAYKRTPMVIIDCAGVGYEVETPMSTFLELPRKRGWREDGTGNPLRNERQ